MQVIVLPVGHDLGSFHSGGWRAPVHQVRLGARLVELTGPQAGAWTLAHGLVDAGSVVACTETELRFRCGDGVVDELLGQGLLAAVGTGGGREFAARHRLLPLAVGVGNTAEEPWMFGVGELYQPLAVLSGALFDLWQWAHLSADLWLACAEVADVARRSGVDDPALTDPEQVLAGALGALPQVLGARVGCLDLRDRTAA
ncbi:hypothetical protein [Pseudonocardia alni]|uniref:hypothetical protein n=1 Tax=Pseudonocardia alni TaxID=33907 RepID=UPI00280A55D3|nr:hypothetical protein [Pseudonocardia alni]